MSKEAEENSSSFVIVVHAGAGDHPKQAEVGLLRTIRRALRAAHSAVSNGDNGQTVITEAMSVLEDSPLTNAGIGSSLNLDGEVECDSSIVDGSDPNAFASVAALKKIKNPSKAAVKVLDFKLKSDLPCGLLLGSAAALVLLWSKLLLRRARTLRSGAVNCGHEKPVGKISEATRCA